MTRLRESTFLRDAAVATLVVVALYALTSVQFQPVQIPGYLVLVGFLTLESALGATGTAYAVLFGAYLLALGLAGASVAHVVRDRLPDGDGWRYGTAGALAVVGAGALLFALGVAVGTRQFDAVAVAGASGVALLGLAAWLVKAFEWRVRSAG